jgi:hypothetical protein
MSHRTPEEVEAHYRQMMGMELGEIFHRVWDQCASLHEKWDEYVTLFGTTPERVTLLNQAAPSFFCLVQRTLWNEILLHICRLTDSPRSGGKDNLTVRRFPDLVNESIRPMIVRLLGDIASKTEFARDWRNRQIAHLDFALARGQSAQPLMLADRESVNRALSALVSLLNAVEGHYCETETFYDISSLGGANGLLYVIRDGLEAENARKERFRAGTPTVDDVRPKPSI